MRAEGGFPLTVRRGRVADLVAPEEVEGRAAFLCRPIDEAVVLGSTQPESSLDRHEISRRGDSLVRRRSGGGAVFVAPSAQVWLDLFVPVDDPLFERDVARAAHFVGELWSDALRTLGRPGAPLAVHRGAVRSSPWSRAWCFTGLGPGEVTVAGRKLVGLSQRRSRAGAWFFTMARLLLDPARDASLVSATGAEATRLAEELERSGATLDAPLEAVEAALGARLALA